MHLAFHPGAGLVDIYWVWGLDPVRFDLLADWPNFAGIRLGHSDHRPFRHRVLTRSRIVSVVRSSGMN
jgi:hypothetical protein